MRLVFALILMLGLLLAGMAVFMAQSYMGQQEQALARANAQAQRWGTMVAVYAAKEPMGFGTTLTPDMVKQVYVQQEHLPAGAFVVPTDSADKGTKADPALVLFPDDNEKPRQLIRSLESNEILLASRITDPGQSASLTDKLGAGMRAFQITVDVSSGVQGFIIPDSHVDIYWTSAEVTRMIETAVKVIAVDGASDEGQRNLGNARTITVAVNPEQVARLAQAQSTGRMTMSLAAPGDEGVVQNVRVDRDALMGNVAPEAPQATIQAAPEVCTIRTRRGADLIETAIPCTN